jgi:predicted DNA-binding protein YlxM (UPF0122 family)
MQKQLNLSRKILYNLYWKQKLSMSQIAEKLKISKTSVERYLKKFEIKIRNTEEGQKTRLQLDGRSWFWNYINDKLTGRQKQMILGAILGDGTLYLRGRSKNARLKIQHTEKDKKYVEYKCNILKKFVASMGIKKETTFNPKTKKYYTSYTFVTVSHPEFTKYRKLFYLNGKKIVNKKILNQLTPFSLAIWIMDDGYYNIKGDFMELYTMDFNFEENSLIQNWFKNNYGISPQIEFHKQSKKHYLRFNIKNTKELIKIITPFINPCMERKIGRIV